MGFYEVRETWKLEGAGNRKLADVWRVTSGSESGPVSKFATLGSYKLPEISKFWFKVLDVHVWVKKVAETLRGISCIYGVASKT